MKNKIHSPNVMINYSICKHFGFFFFNVVFSLIGGKIMFKSFSTNKKFIYYWWNCLWNEMLYKGAVHKWHHPFFEIFDPSLPLVTHFTEWSYGVIISPFRRFPFPQVIYGWLTTKNCFMFQFWFLKMFRIVAIQTSEEK